MNLTELAKEIYAGNKERGFWDEERNFGELLMLVVSELGEAIESHRKGWNTVPAQNVEFMLTLNDAAFNEAFKDSVKDTVEDEIADAIIRLLDLCGGLGINIDAHVKAKLKYNASRPKLHGKKY